MSSLTAEGVFSREILGKILVDFRFRTLAQ